MIIYVSNALVTKLTALIWIATISIYCVTSLQHCSV